MLMRGRRVLLIIAAGYTEPELWTPLERFREEGAEVIVAGPKKGIVQGEGVHGFDGCLAEITHTVEEAMKIPYDMLFLSGGLWSPMELRTHEPTLRCVRQALEKGILTCAICHAPWILISAGVVKGKHICCPDDMAIDVENAGGIYDARCAVLDGNLLTGTAFPWIPEFMQMVMETVRQRWQGASQ